MKLKPCPFCGGEAQKQAKEVNGLRAIYVVCKKCGASSGIYKTRNPRVKDEENPAIKAWNRRELIDRIVEQLEAEEYDVNCNICDYDSEIDTNTFQYYEGKEDGIREAIEMVKSGGKV